MASLPVSRGPSTYSSSSSSSGTTSSDSDEGSGHQQGSNGGGTGSTGAAGGGTAPAAEGDDSDDADSAMLAGCSLQEIRQEDLAAILPDQQDVDAFNDFDECREDKRSPAGADLSGEGSDMELPQQAVNALIQRTTESSSEGETHAPPPPSSLYANSLLQQFVAQTQMLNAPCPPIPVSEALKPPMMPSTNAEPQNKKTVEEGAKKRRGRPKKDLKTDKAQEYCTNPNVSPDSGIQNSPDHVSSPEPTMSPNVNQKKPQKEEAKKVEKPVAKNLRNDKSTSNNNKNNKATVLKPAPTNNKVPATTVKVSANNNKLAVTANRFDRMLYANADKVLYPPRRKGGRAASNKKPPGRTARSKQPVTVAPSPAEAPKPLENKVAPPLEKQAKAPKTKTRTRPVLSTKNKMETKGKYQTLKVPKLMHSKHKHKKHKKYKFKILKPIGENSPKINIEIDKLIADFVKCCAIATKQPKENVPEQILKTLKKVTKKRKTAEYSDKKKKKQSISTTVAKVSSNDQRLPLKKRHYHLLSNNESKNESEEVKAEVEEETRCDKAKIKSKITNNTPKTEADDDKSDKAKVKPKVITSTPKVEVQKSPVNAKYVPVIKSNTSVKASINNNEYESKESKKDVVSHIDEAIEACIYKFADKKVETKTESNTSEEKVNSSSNSITATTPKKRHRLEMASAVEKATPMIKTEPAVVTEEKMEKAKPKINIESYISELKAKRSTGTKQGPEEKKVVVKEETKVSVNNEEVLKVTPESRKKVRKRRAINRTGFPTVKKKKKKSLPTEAPATVVVPRSSEPRPNSCDRVPKQGEEYTKFVERTESIPDKELTEDSIISLSRTLDDSSKWETMSECESLPQDERTEFDDDYRDRMTLRQRDSSPATSVDTRSSERSKANGDDLEHSLSHSIERLRSRLELRKKRKRMRDKDGGTYPKRRPSSAESPYISALKDDRASASGDERKGRKSQAPRWRKKYLVAGLFSDYYKEDDETARLKRQDSAQKSSRLVYNPEEHPYGLLPPPYHCGKYLRCRKIPFQLPYDLWWQHTHSQLPGRDIVPSWNYRKIRTNVYTEKLTTTLGSCEPQTCNCRSPSGSTGNASTLGCGDDCINRLVLSECPPAVGHRCKNQRIQRHEWAPALEKFMTEDKGTWIQRVAEGQINTSAYYVSVRNVHRTKWGLM
nr:unnamed protein product [Callosobruchus analis]